MKSPEDEKIIENVKVNPDILDLSLSHLSERQRFDYLQQAAS